MKQKGHYLAISLLCISLLLLILDSKTAAVGAREGISLCSSVVIPSLFPFLILSAMLPGRILGSKQPATAWLCRLCGIPDGAQSLLLLSFLGGYPMGAAMVTEAYNQGSISKSDAHRMLGFCNNAGPAFLFGMVSGMFTDKRNIWVIWLIHIVSALLVGILLPYRSQGICKLNKQTPVTVTQALPLAVKTMANICGWVIIFRVFMAILDKWPLYYLPNEFRISTFGLLELSNGIISLSEIPAEGGRFILSCGMLAFGGLCIAMQTASVTNELGIGMYFPGKLLQCLFSVLLSIPLQYLLFPAEKQIRIPSVLLAALACGIFVLIFFLRREKSSSISGENIV